MDDSGKRSELVCTKVTERVFIDLGRAAAQEDRSVSDFVFLLIRHELYGRTLQRRETDSDLQG
jgi:hypothetical protein